jgi:hypothetical protein
MADMELRPKGTGPGVLETLISGAGQYLTSYQDQQEKELKKTKEKTDAYVALRKAGYSKEQAYSALQKGVKEAPEGEYNDLEDDLTRSKIDYYKGKSAKTEKPDTTSKLKDRIKMQIYDGEQLSKQDYDFALREGLDVPNESMPSAVMGGTEKPKQGKYDIDKAKNWGEVPFLQRVIAAATPSATKTEQKLGALRPGGIFKTPKEKGAEGGIKANRVERARAYITSKRGKASDEDVYKFLQKYPDFQ